MISVGSICSKYLHLCPKVFKVHIYMNCSEDDQDLYPKLLSSNYPLMSLMSVSCMICCMIDSMY